MNRQNRNRNVNNQYSRDFTANGYGNGNRMERASNWGQTNSRSNFNRSNGDGNYNNNGNMSNAFVQLLSMMTSSLSNAGQFSTNGPSRPHGYTARMNRSWNGPSDGNRPSRQPRRQGWKPEVARQTSGELRRRNSESIGSPPSKRGRVEQRDLPIEKAGRKNTPTRPIVVAVMPKEYPRDLIQPEELVKLEEAIIDEVAKGHEKKIHFNSVKQRNNLLYIECKDWDTYGWLKRTVRTLSGWEGAPLVACLERRIPKPCNIRVFLPGSAGKTHEEILGTIKAQNDSLHTGRWTIQSSTEENGGQTLVITIADFTCKVIARNGNTICYRFGTVPVEILAEKKVRNAKNNSTTSRPIKVAVLPKEYPRVSIDQNELKELEEAIIDEVANGFAKTIRFTGIEHRDGLLVIDCKDLTSCDWLKTMAPKLSAWKGVPLIACAEKNIPKKEGVEVEGEEEKAEVEGEEEEQIPENVAGDSAGN